MFRLLLSAGFAACISTPLLADTDSPRAVGVGPVRVVGAPEVIFDWTTDRCYEAQVPDLPVRAFRDAEDRVNLILSHDTAHRMVGSDFDTLKLDCSALMESRKDPEPANFANHEWIASVYTEDGETVHALVHNEHQGNRYVGCTSREYFKCWYNTVTYARSEDGGASFGRPFAPPDHLIGALPVGYKPDEGIFGLFSPSNIIKHEGFYYAYAKAQTYPVELQPVCLMRTDDLGSPAAWRYWDGKAFEGGFLDPFAEAEQAKRASNCAPIALGEIAQIYEGVSWNETLGKFVLVGTSSNPTRDPNLFGFYYALSDDLISWSRRLPLVEVRLPWRATGQQTTYLYPTLIDHTDGSRNFEVTGGEAYLYFTRLNKGSGHLDRDLLRMKVEISASQ